MQDLNWHDARDRNFDTLDFDNCVALILNVKAQGLLSWLTGGRHWFALRQLGGMWWNLDSGLAQPEVLGSTEDARRFLRAQADEADAQVFAVTPRAAGQEEQQQQQRQPPEGQSELQQQPPQQQRQDLGSDETTAEEGSVQARHAEGSSPA